MRQQLSTNQRLNLKEAAQFLGIAYKTLRNWRYEGRPAPPFYMIGTKVVYKLSDLEAWMEARRAVIRN